jgi:hypothetical protein
MFTSDASSEPEIQRFDRGWEVQFELADPVGRYPRKAAAICSAPCWDILMQGTLEQSTLHVGKLRMVSLLNSPNSPLAHPKGWGGWGPLGGGGFP